MFANNQKREYDFSKNTPWEEHDADFAQFLAEAIQMAADQVSGNQFFGITKDSVQNYSILFANLYTLARDFHGKLITEVDYEHFFCRMTLRTDILDYDQFSPQLLQILSRCLSFSINAGHNGGILIWVEVPLFVKLDGGSSAY